MIKSATVSARIDEIHRAEGLQIEDMILEEVGEALRSRGAKADIFVHMESVDSFPFDALLGAKMREHIILRGGSGEDHVDFLFGLEKRADAVCNVLCGSSAHQIAVFEDTNGKLVFRKDFHIFSP